MDRDGKIKEVFRGMGEYNRVKTAANTHTKKKERVSVSPCHTFRLGSYIVAFIPFDSKTSSMSTERECEQWERKVD